MPSRTAAGLMMVALALTGCREAPDAVATPAADPNAVIARYAGGEIRRSEIQAGVERRLQAVPPPVAPEVRRDIVRKVVERRVRIATMRAAMRTSGFEEGGARYPVLAAE